MKKDIFTKVLLVSFVSTFSYNTFAQGVFNGAVSNPFALCSAPRPCDKCQPLRSYWDQICPAGDKNKFPEATNSITAKESQIASKNDVSNNPQKTAMQNDLITNKNLNIETTYGVVGTRTDTSTQNIIYNGEPAQIITTKNIVTKMVYGNDGRYVNKDFIQSVNYTLNGYSITQAQYDSIINSSKNATPSQGGRLF